MPNLDMEGFSFHFEDDGAGMPLVFLHPFPFDGRVFSPLRRALGNDFRVIVPDLRGYGRSVSEAPFTMEKLADDVHALLSTLGASPAVVVGNSMGGYVALELAAKWPEDVAALALVGSRAQADTSDQKIARMQSLANVQRLGASSLIEGMLPKLLGAKTQATRPDLVNEVRAIMESVPARSLEHGILGLLARVDHMKTLAELRVPVLLAVGAEDVLTPPSFTEAMHEVNRGAEMAVLDGVGHLVPLEAPDALEALLRALAERAKVER